MKKTNLKKFLLLFCMLACVFCMTACTNTISSSTAKQNAKNEIVEADKNEFKTWAMDMISYLDKNSEDQIKNDAESAKTLNKVNGDKKYVVNPDGMNTKTIEFYNSWNKTRTDLGALKSIDKFDVTVSDETGVLGTIIVDATYENRTCTFEMIIDDDFNLSSVAINPTFTTGEKMQKAGMNTLLGMGTVFIVLIFISFVISLLGHVNKIGNKKKDTAAEDQSVDKAISQIVTAEESEEDDCELVAVISAAIAASEGTSTDGFVVRSIKKVGRAKNWKNS